MHVAMVKNSARKRFPALRSTINVEIFTPSPVKERMAMMIRAQAQMLAIIAICDAPSSTAPFILDKKDRSNLHSEVKKARGRVLTAAQKAEY